MSNVNLLRNRYQYPVAALRESKLKPTHCRRQIVPMRTFPIITQEKRSVISNENLAVVGNDSCLSHKLDGHTRRPMMDDLNQVSIETDLYQDICTEGSFMSFSLHGLPWKSGKNQLC